MCVCVLTCVAVKANVTVAVLCEGSSGFCGALEARTGERAAS